MLPALSLMEARALEPLSFKELLFFLPASSAERSWIKPLMRREALPRFPVGAALKCTFFHSMQEVSKIHPSCKVWNGIAE